MSETRTADILVIGGGILGLSVAREAARRGLGRVVVLEKEARCGAHASSRNSGVLHAGFYYDADSLKARFCREGNAALAAWCETHRLPLRPCGKLVVARSEADLPGLDRLYERGRANGVELELVDEADLRRIEPAARTTGRALYSPGTASVDPAQVMAALEADVREAGVDVRAGTAYRGLEPRPGAAAPHRIRTSAGRLEVGFVVNAAGLYADRVARDFGFSRGHGILPFRGRYLRLPASAGRLRTHIYPVPDPAAPFLGVHLTVAVSGEVTVGPTAGPALWREHYRGIAGLRASELLEIAGRGAGLWLRDDFGFRRLARAEIRKRSRWTLIRSAHALARGLSGLGATWGEPGLRAQLVDLAARRLEMDFRVEGDAASLHVLNAVSPGFTSAFPFARWLVDRIELSG
ncbi:MAG: L-2-hydroxyglutarate oxidase [Gemmatimonadota bacterium]